MADLEKLIRNSLKGHTDEITIERYMANLREQDINSVKVFGQLNEGDLERLGFTMGHRRLIESSMRPSLFRGKGATVVILLFFLGALSLYLNKNGISSLPVKDGAMKKVDPTRDPFHAWRKGADLLMPISPPADWLGWSCTWFDERENHMLAYYQNHFVPPFTSRGFEVVDTPPRIQELLVKELKKGLQTHREEGYINVFNGSSDALKPWFYNIGAIANRIMKDPEIVKMHEDWAGVKVVPQAAYGLRIYREGGLLKKHVDRVQSHIISSIVHIGHETDEPWRLVINDHNEVPHAVSLQPGQMLHYESAKLQHWRKDALKGKNGYYCSLFIHYSPENWPVQLNPGDVKQHFPEDWTRGTRRGTGKDFPGAQCEVAPGEYDTYVNIG